MQEGRRRGGRGRAIKDKWTATKRVRHGKVMRRAKQSASIYRNGMVTDRPRSDRQQRRRKHDRKDHMNSRKFKEGGRIAIQYTAGAATELENTAKGGVGKEKEWSKLTNG